VKHLRRKGIGERGIVFAPAAFDFLQRRMSSRKRLAQAQKILQRLSRVAQFVHGAQLRQIGYPVVAHFQIAFQPRAQHPPPGRGDVIDALARPALGLLAPAAEKPPAFQPLECGIDLAQLRSPEAIDALVKNGFQSVAAGRLPQQTQQDVLQTHSATI